METFNKMMALLDEKDPRWIKLYKIITLVAFFCWIVLGVFAAIDNWAWGYVFDIYIFDTYFFGGVFLLLCGAVIGFAQLAANMLVIQFLNNVQVIREKLETM